MKTVNLLTLEEAVDIVVRKYGSIRAAARATGVDKAFLSRLRRGLKVNPSKETLEALGLEYRPFYIVKVKP